MSVAVVETKKADKAPRDTWAILSHAAKRAGEGSVE